MFVINKDIFKKQFLLNNTINGKYKTRILLSRFGRFNNKR